jgi:catechol 2,3-dioxygenase-like lactoylglutathione lyase family enzyme
MFRGFRRERRRENGTGMTTKRSVDEPWKTPDEYGRSLPNFTVNLMVRDVARTIHFYTRGLEARVDYQDVDFAALLLGSLQFMIHADHTYDRHPWFPRLQKESARGLGAELRLFNIDPDRLEGRARDFGATILQPAQEKPHGWRDVIVADPDEYAWAVGRPGKT